MGGMCRVGETLLRLHGGGGVEAYSRSEWIG